MTTPAPDLNAVAAEICAMWHDYLQRLAKDDAGRAELVKMLEPQMRLFQNWPKEVMNPWLQAASMHPSSTPSPTSPPPSPARHDSQTFQDKEPSVHSAYDAQHPQSSDAVVQHAAQYDTQSGSAERGHSDPEPGSDQDRCPNLSPELSTTAAPSSDDGALRVAQLALRVAALEERLSRLEARHNRRPRKNSGTGED